MVKLDSIMIPLQRFLGFFTIYFEKAQSFAILCLVSPGFFFIEMYYVRNNLIDYFEPSDLVIMMFTALTIFGFINIIGNYALSVFVNNSVDIIDDRYADETWSHCDVCNRKRPPKSWHCKSCQVCILGRDHHCFFMAKCIGQYNKRFYLLYSVYLCLGMIYCTVFNFLYIYVNYENVNLWRFIRVFLIMIDPMGQPIMDLNKMVSELFFLYFNFNLFLLCWSASLVNFHLRNAVDGVSSYERKGYSKGRSSASVKENLIRVFGENWYWALVWPFAVSPLPDEKIV